MIPSVHSSDDGALPVGDHRIVAIIALQLPRYRVAFFERLRLALQCDGIELRLLYGAGRGDATGLDWATAAAAHEVRIGGRSAIWQRIPASIRNADVVVLAQENRLISNYPILLRGLLRRKRVALWGHGSNRQESGTSIANRFKAYYSRHVHWWFAYTDGVARRVAGTGFPTDRITIVENAIDTVELMLEAQRLQPEDLAAVRNLARIGAGPIGLYCGELRAQKRIPFLLEAADRIRGMVPGFELVIIGSGAEMRRVREFAATRSWVHVVGPIFGLTRVPYFRLADVFLMPGAIGLALLDAFALETPPVVVRVRDHGPEIEYLDDRQNGLLVGDSVGDFAEAAASVLTTPHLREHLRAGCRVSARRYTIERMVENFRRGLTLSLNAPLR